MGISRDRWGFLVIDGDFSRFTVAIEDEWGFLMIMGISLDLMGSRLGLRVRLS